MGFNHTIQLSLFLLIISNSFGQTRISSRSNSFKGDSTSKVAWLKQNALAIRSIDPADEDFSDLMSLKKIIGDAQVVGIGEPNHHVGSIYLAKTRLIKFLHKEMGFDLLIFESGMYDAAKAWKEINAGGDVRQAFKNSIFFSGREEFKPLINYLQQTLLTKKPLELAGFDSQMNAKYSRDSLFSDLRRFFKVIGYSSENLNDSSFFARELVKVNGYNGYKTADKIVFDTLSMLLNKLTFLTPKPLYFEAGFYYQLLKSIRREVMSKTLFNIRHLSGKDLQRLYLLSFNMRDEQMAENLLWYINQYPKRKIIIIAHNAHLMMDYPGDITKQDWNFKPDAPPAPKWRWDQNYMGYILRDSLKEKIFNISIQGNKGEFGWINHLDSTKSFRESVEKYAIPGGLVKLLDAAGFQQAFVSLKNPPKGGEWLKGRISLTGGEETEWHKAIDGIFYIKNFTLVNIKD